MYGGSTTSILLNTPGESASIVTALEGNKMARAGRGGPALATAAIGSFVAGLIATLGLAFIAPYIVKLALVFGPREYFALMVLAFVTVSSAFGDSALRGLTSLFIGFALAMVGIDQQTGQARLSFGIPDLLDGVEVTTLAVAMFAIGETLYIAAQGNRIAEKVEAVKGSLWMTAEDWSRSWKPWLRGTLIGFPIGAMPSWRRRNRHVPLLCDRKAAGEKPGRVRPWRNRRRGRSRGGEQRLGRRSTLVPLLTLGLPTTATAAIMLAAFQQYGLQPGPLLFATNPQLVWGLIASLLIANAMLLVLNLPMIGLWVRLLTIPKPWLYA